VAADGERVKSKGTARRVEVAVRYVESNPDGNRASRRMAAKEARAAAKGREVGTSTGAAPHRPVRRLP
jgi:hypothetical protein